MAHNFSLYTHNKRIRDKKEYITAMYERNTIGDNLEMEQAFSVMLGLNNPKESSLKGTGSLQKASPSPYLDGERKEGRSYTKLGELENIYN